MHLDLTPDGDSKGELVNADSYLCIEIWNLVFIQFNADRQGNFTLFLPSMLTPVWALKGSLRSCSQLRVLLISQNPTSNYDTDVFSPIFEKIEDLSGKSYNSTLPANGKPNSDQEEIDIAFRVIGDHLRALCFSIADGILPGNNDRNYVLRRILRRGVRYGRNLGFEDPFFHKLAPVLIDQLGSFFPELEKRKDLICKTLQSEETSFNKTLDRGIDLFNREIKDLDKGAQISGSFAFKLYDTFGFPFDLTELMARENELTIDNAGFDKEMDTQKKRAREAHKSIDILVSDSLDSDQSTEFVGYENQFI